MAVRAKRYRDLLLFVVGLNTALRISDLLQLSIGDFIDDQGEILDGFSIQQEKREKRNQVVINASIRDALEKYLSAYPQAAAKPDHFVFFSSKRHGPNYTRPLSRVQA